jgi:hypothetical protein
MYRLNQGLGTTWKLDASGNWVGAAGAPDGYVGRAAAVSYHLRRGLGQSTAPGSYTPAAGAAAVQSGLQLTQEAPCSNSLYWVFNSNCWAMTPGEWETYAQLSSTVGPGPAAPTAEQLQAGSAGGDAAAQVTAQLAAGQAATQQTASAGQVATDVSPIANLAADINELTGSIGCTSSILPPICDSSIYIVGAVALGLAVLFLSR